MNVCDRFLSYVKIYTPSDEESESVPSSACQLDLARLLCREMEDIGFSDVRLADGYVYGTLPATPGYEEACGVGFIAHMDTVSECCAHAPCPVVHPGYDGGDVLLTGAGGEKRVLSPADFPDLARGIGKTLITSDGTTLLGADDKAGIAEILTAVERIVREGIPHGKIAVGFTPDEEIGRGADHFDVAGFGVPVAFTLDGAAVGGIEYENFNADRADVCITGVAVHPGGAKGRMVNAASLAAEYAMMLPSGQTPERTEWYEGFIHLTGMEGSVEGAKLSYIVRDHDLCKLHDKENTMRSAARALCEKYGEGSVRVTFTEQYRNMSEVIREKEWLIGYAEEAIRSVGITPGHAPIRGGTDGARLSFLGLPCPNLGTGMEGCHGPYEHIFVEDMERATDVLVALVRRFGERK